MQNNKGFTLIEIIVAVALVAILSAAIAPSVINNIAQGRIARTQSDCQAIAQAIARFRSDVGFFPYLVKPHSATPADRTLHCQFLASLDGKFPTLGTTGTINWPIVITTTGASDMASCEDFTSHLIMGSGTLGWPNGPSGAVGDTAHTNYTRASNPDDPKDVGFRGAVMSSDPADPWGNKYLCNIGAAGMVGEALWVISAGPNGIIETTWTTVTPTGAKGVSTTLGGDDLGYRLQ